MSYSVQHINPKIYNVNAPPSEYIVNQTDTKTYIVGSIQKLFSITSSSYEFSALQFIRPTYIVASASVIDNNIYAPGAAVGCDVTIKNYGASGSQLIIWQVVDNSDNVLSSGSQSSGVILKWDTDIVELSGITAPETEIEFRVRIKIGETGSWLYSEYAQVLPVDLTVTAVHPGSDIYWPDTTIDCHVHVINAGFAGSQTIEWQVIKTSDESILSSGSQDSGMIGDFASAQVNLSGIVSPSGDDIQFKIRARIEGSSNWLYTMPMANYMFITPPENPTPRG